MGDGKPLPSTAWRRGITVVYGFGIVVALVTVAGSLRWIDWFWPTITGFYGVVACVLSWFVVSIVGAVRYRQVWAYILAPALVLGLIGAADVARLPERAQFAVSESALISAAAECTPVDGEWVGAYRVERVAQFHGACLFYLRGYFMDRGGFAVMPHGPLRDERRQFNVSTTHLTGDVYLFVEHF
ncbi:hypothetical protein WKY82_04305 [Gordonia malaquae]|uniref:hypothetical protein n=1 Tax=Gordonia TaxID=2053 RepID=UPI0030C78E29